MSWNPADNPKLLPAEGQRVVMYSPENHPTKELACIFEKGRFQHPADPQAHIGAPVYWRDTADDCGPAIPTPNQPTERKVR